MDLPLPCVRRKNSPFRAVAQRLKIGDEYNTADNK